MELKQTFSLALLVLLVFAALIYIPTYYEKYDFKYGLDGGKHKSMASNPEYQPHYAPLSRIIGEPFAVRNQTWNLFVVILFLIITPLLIVKITGEWLTAWFYYSVSYYPYYALSGYFAQALMFVFVLGMFATKDNRLRILLLLIGSLSHSYAPLLLFGTFGLILLQENLGLIKTTFKNAWLGLILLDCSPLFGNSKETLPSNLQIGVPSATLGNLDKAGNITKDFALNLLSFGFMFVKAAPFPFLIVAIKQLIKEKRIALLGLALGSFGFCFIVGVRPFYLVSLVSTIGFALAWNDLKHKKVWLFATFISFVWLAFNFVMAAVVNGVRC